MKRDCHDGEELAVFESRLSGRDCGSEIRTALEENDAMLTISGLTELRAYFDGISSKAMILAGSRTLDSSQV